MIETPSQLDCLTLSPYGARLALHDSRELARARAADQRIPREAVGSTPNLRAVAVEVNQRFTASPMAAVPVGAAVRESRRRCGCCVAHREHLGASAEQPGKPGAQLTGQLSCDTQLTIYK